MKLKEAGKIIENDTEETLPFAQFLSERQTRIHTSIALGHLNHEIRRRTRVLGHVPDG